jgi:hypothetical protein
MFDAFDENIENIEILDRPKLMLTLQKIKSDIFYQLYEGLKAMKATLGDVVKLEYLLLS